MYGPSRLKRTLNLVTVVFIEVWVIGLVYFLADKLGFLPPRAEIYARLNQPTFSVMGHVLLLWQIIAQIAYTLLFVLIIRLLFKWPWFRRGFQRQRPAQEPPRQEPAPQIDARFRVEIHDARPIYTPPTPDPAKVARPATPEPAPRTAPPTPPPAKPEPKPAAPAPQATPPQPPTPATHRKIPYTSADWKAANPSTKIKTGPAFEPLPSVINLPAAKDLPVIELGPPTEPLKIYREKPRPARQRPPKPPGAPKPKRLRKYQPTEED